ncbi:MAG: hypothetical protein JNJ45_10935 [Chthonomonas sp.]|nr:hypothetical protein [Chthonomonas sp.]
MCAVIVSASLPVATQSRIKADLLGKATNLAQQQLERVRGTGYPNLSAAALQTEGLIDSVTPIAADTYSFTAVGNGTNEAVSQVLPSGTGQIRVEQADLDLRRVIVTVQYSDRGQTRTVRVGTLVANL